jgi:putative two-component system response regulator
VPDALSACVAGYETAGQPDVALVYLHELLALNKDARGAQVLMHHREHVAQLEQLAQPAKTIDRTLAVHQDKLRYQLGDRELTRNRMLLLEQQSVAAELHDDATGEHCYRVGRLASILGKEIGLEEDVCFLIDLAARLHDIGKLVVPDAILLKPGKLTPGEFEIMQTHTTAGADILAKSNVPQMHIAEEIARHHHEKWDGSGYPMKLAGTAIPIAARVTALADVFDALTHVRPYKKAWSVRESLEEIQSLRGRQFDPELTDVFLKLVPSLQRQHGDLDEFLAVEAKTSPFIQARKQIAAALKGSDPSTSLFDIRR